MKCSRCQHENPAEAEFCAECAAPLGRACPNCGHQVSAVAKFCSECAHPIGLAPESRAPSRFVSPRSYTPKHLANRILRARSTLEGERKYVTVLFADIKGSLELLADRDPEEAQKLLDPVLERMMEAVHRYEGTVHRVMGDGIMALFGAPLAHEDHAVRACYASLRMQETVGRYANEIQRSHGVPVTIRVGLNSGEIAIRAIGNDLHMEYTVVGQTAHLAARMEQMAQPGSVLATADTLRLAEGYVAVNAIGLVPVKGLAYPIEVYEIVGGGPARTRLQAAARRGLTRFVGRDDEMGRLHEALAQVCGGQGQVAAVVGDPGLGKSRLVHEFLHSPGAADCLILESSAASYGQATPYLPIVELLKSYFKVDARDTTKAIRDKVADKVFALDAALQDAIPAILDLLDAQYEEHPFRSLDPLQHRLLTYQAVIRLLLSETRAQPVVAVFEDLHWSDSLTLGLLNELVAAAREARLLLLASYRPEYKDAWKGAANYRQLRLEPLASESLAELLEALLGTDKSLAFLKKLLLDRASGNPFFAEEIVRSLVDTGVLEGGRADYRLVKPYGSAEVPPTVQGVLGARIDALPATEKHLLQAAAVIGQDVPFPLLQAIAGLAEDDLRGILANLQAAELLDATQLFPDLHYRFKHALTHHVAYAGLLHERCRDIHAQIVDAMETLYGDRLSEQVERLADHALQGQLWEKAVAYCRQAGTKAADRQAYREALTLFEQALSALGRLPDSRATQEQAIDLRFDMRNVLQPLGERERIAALLGEVEPLATRLGDTGRIGLLHSYLTEQFWMLGRYREAAVAGERALAVAEALDDLPLRIITDLPLGLAHHTRGDYRKAMQYFRSTTRRLEGERIHQRFGLFVLPSSFARSFIAWSCAELGDFAEAFAAGDEALRIAEAAEHPFSLGYAHCGLGVLFLRQGDPRRALRSLERALGTDAFTNSPVGFAYVAFHQGYALALAGRPLEGIAILEKTVRVAECKGFIARHALRLAYLGEALVLAGRGGEAEAAAARALTLARAQDERANEAYALRVLGELTARAGRLAEAEMHFTAALALSQALGMRPLQAHCHRGLGEILDAMDRAADAAAHRGAATALAEDMQLRFWSDWLLGSSAA